MSKDSSMIDELQYQESLMYKALVLLDEELTKMHALSLTLNVVGGFALVFEGVRYSSVTDVDYIGPDLPRKVKEIADEIGIEVGLGRGWLNNDLMLAGTDLEDLEWSTGELSFHKGFELNTITVNILDKECLLRMKVIAVDTNYSAIEFGGDFSRSKDFYDIKALMEDLDYDFKTLVNRTDVYVTCNPEVYNLIKYYLKTGDTTAFLTPEIKKIARGKF